MIDLFESIIKTHTIVIMAEYFNRNELSDTSKGLLAAGLRTPSLGTWQLFSRELFKELKAVQHPFLLADFVKEFELLDKALNNENTNIISVRNGYAHGATPSDEDCERDINQFESFLQLLLRSSWLTQSSIIDKEGKAFLISLEKKHGISLHPLLVVKTEENAQPFAFFNDLKDDKVGLLNYPLSKHYREKEFFSEFNSFFPLKEWKKTGSNEFNQRIEELTETFKGRNKEREEIRQFAMTKNKGYLSVQGNPGIGKSALIAQVYKDLTSEEIKLSINLIAYFIRRGTAQADPLILLNFLIKNTDQFFPVGKDIIVEGKTNWDLQQQLFNKWRAYGESKPSKKLLILIDGLDEGVENEILSYLPRESFKDVLVIYGARLGGHKDLVTFWGELPVEQHQKIELSGLNKNDIRALLYEVSSKYELEKDSEWIDIVETSSEGNPLYLRLLCKAIENGSIRLNDPKALPKEIDEYYKAIMDRYSNDKTDGDALLSSLYVFASAFDFLLSSHLSAIYGFGVAQTQRVDSTLKEVLSENPITEDVSGYQLFHESFREYLLKNKTSEIRSAEKKILAFCTHWKEYQGDWEQRYALQHYVKHLCCNITEEKLSILFQLCKDTSYIQTQKKVLRGFDATKELYKNAITSSIDKGQNEEVIIAALGLVDLSYEEQNDAVNIVAMVANNEMELALTRITVYGGPSREEKKRQFMLFMLCLMELTLLCSKEQPWRKGAIEKLLKHLEGQIPEDHSILKWNVFFPSYLMFLIALEIKQFSLDYCQLFKRTDKWDQEWINEKGPYTETQFEVLIQSAQCISNNYFKSYAFKNISAELAKQGKQEQAAKVIEQALHTAQDLNEGWDWERCSAFQEISTELVKQGNRELADQAIKQALQIAQGISNDYELERDHALKDFSEELSKQGNHEQALQIALGISNNYIRSCTYKNISTELAKQGKHEQAAEIIEQAVQAAHGIREDYNRNIAFKDISIELAKLGKYEQAFKTAQYTSDSRQISTLAAVISTELDKQGNNEQAAQAMQQALLTVKGINDNYLRSSALTDISVEMDRQGNHEQAALTLNQALQIAQDIKDDSYRSSAFRGISTALAKQGNHEQASQAMQQALHAAQSLIEGWDWERSSAFKEISIELARQGNHEQALQTAQGISDMTARSSFFSDISTELAKQGSYALAEQALQYALQTAQEINDDPARSSAFKELAKRGNHEQAAQAIQQSLRTAQGICNHRQRCSFGAFISTELAKQGKYKHAEQVIQQALLIAQGITDAKQRCYAFTDISADLRKQGNKNQAEEVIKQAVGAWIQISDADIMKYIVYQYIVAEQAKQGEDTHGVETFNFQPPQTDLGRSSATFKDTSAELAKQGNYKQAFETAIKIEEGSYRMSFWQELGNAELKDKGCFFCMKQLQILPNDEALHFYKKGMIKFVNPLNASEELVLSLLYLSTEDSDSMEHLLQMYALNCCFFGNITKEKFQLLNKTLNIQWALDIKAQFSSE